MKALIPHNVRGPVTALFLISGAGFAAPQAPAALRAVYTEKSITLTWDSVPGATGYHVYTASTPAAPLEKRRRVNQQLITSGTHFTYIWDVADGEHVRGIKGHRHHIVVRSVAGSGSEEAQSPPSPEIDNCYFEGFDRVETRAKAQAILRDTQQTARLPVALEAVARQEFLACLSGAVATLQRFIRETIDPLVTGACAPLATVLLQLLHECGIAALKAEGVFIKEYHAFVIVNVAGVEYVLDVAADQFVSDVSPVLLPRDRCFLGQHGRFADSGTPVYVVSRLYSIEHSQLVEGEQGEPYRRLLDRTRQALSKAAPRAKRQP